MHVGSDVRPVQVERELGVYSKALRATQISTSLSC
jgi:hypothetical protein